MSKRILVAVVTLLCLCSVLWGQQTASNALTLDKFRRIQLKEGASIMAPNFLALDNPVLFPRSPASPLLNGGFSSLSTTLDWMMPMDGLSGPYPPTPQSRPASVGPDQNLTDRLGSLLPNVDYATAEIGFMYGRSLGKFGGDYKQGYVIGEVGDDRVHISVGAAYEDSNLRFPRQGR